jgi:hypothetical protein
MHSDSAASSSDIDGIQSLDPRTKLVSRRLAVAIDIELGLHMEASIDSPIDWPEQAKKSIDSSRVTANNRRPIDRCCKFSRDHVRDRLLR